MPPTAPPRRTSVKARLALSSILLVCLVASLAAFNAQAATPTNGTVSDATRTVTYTGGPGLTPNGGDCTVPGSCDDFKVMVAVPDGYEASHDVLIRLTFAVSADFDLQVLDAAGNVAATSGNGPGSPEVATIPAKAGVYTVRAVAFAVTPADTYNGMITIRDKSTAPPPVSPDVAPEYANYAAPEKTFDGKTLPNRNGAGEPSIGNNHKTGKTLFQSFTSTFRVTFDDAAGNPAAAKWEDVTGPPNCSAQSLDPILFTDSKQGRTVTSQLLLSPATNSLSCTSMDDGTTWSPSDGGGKGQGVDHQTVGGGPYTPNGPGAPLTSYPNAVYYCSQSIAAAVCSRSDNGGTTYGAAIPMYDLTECGGLHGHVKVAPDGTVYVPVPDCNGEQAVAVSEDDGMNWQVRVVKGVVNGMPWSAGAAPGSDPSVGIGADGTVYFGYQNSDGHARAAVSRDKGKTWTDDQDVGFTMGLQNIVWPAVVGGDGDRAAFAFHGTTSGGNYQDAKFNGTWNLYVAHTFDRGKTWTTRNVTTTDATQKGCIWNGGGSNPCRNLLDFMDITVDKEGRVLVGWADGCILSCVTRTFEDLDAEAAGQRNATAGYRTELATISRQLTGKRLFAAFDPPAAATPVPTSNIPTATTAPVTAEPTRDTGGDRPTPTTKPGTATTGPTTGGTTATTAPTTGGAATTAPTTNPNNSRVFLPLLQR